MLIWKVIIKKKEENHMQCSVCKRNMTTKDGTTLVGVSIQISARDDEFFEHIAEVYPEFSTPFRADICYVCWLKSLGVNICKLEALNEQ
jgi:uncharacterized protein (DUF2225 family)